MIDECMSSIGFCNCKSYPPMEDKVFLLYTGSKNGKWGSLIPISSTPIAYWNITAFYVGYSFQCEQNILFMELP